MKVKVCLRTIRKPSSGILTLQFKDMLRRNTI